MANSALVPPYIPMLRDETEQLKQELKETIEAHFQERHGRSAALDERILENEEEKEALFESADIYDLLETYVNALSERHNTSVKGDDGLQEALEDILCEMTMEAEGIVA